KIIDECYENGYTSTILDTLAAKGVKAVFFVTMQYCRSQPAIVQRIINEGHVLGNHSVNHYSMPTLSIDQMEYEILELHNYILNTYGYEMFLFRPPMGEFSTQSLAVTQNLGYKTVHWSFAYLDYDTANQPEYYAALDRVTGAAHSGAIYLLHAVSATNTAILGDVIDSFRNQGYTIGLFK
ncbi:MAG: polysaccharide deacetylase family protein, partial [Clostridia bacterium]|nr:polysaccharide deacetylase family protein [Clostridia bacterium]